MTITIGMNAIIPRIRFTHDRYISDYTGNRDSKRDFYRKKVILLVRDPRDVAVSNYFQWISSQSLQEEAC